MSAEKRQRLFDLYSSNFALYYQMEPACPRPVFICPVCLEGFTREAIDGPSPTLNLAHVVSDCLGGRYCTLTCTNCNGHGGQELEPALAAKLRQDERNLGLRAFAGARLAGPWGNVGVEFFFRPEQRSFSLHAVAKQSNPTDLAALQRFCEESTQAPRPFCFNLSFSVPPRSRRPELAIYQSVYLTLFAYFGYELLWQGFLDDMRRQLLQPEEDIWRAQIAVAGEVSPEALPDGRPFSIMFLREPHPALLVILRMRPREGQASTLIVVLPSPDGTVPPMLQIDRLLDGDIVPFRPGLLATERCLLGRMWQHVRAAG
jgi:hypothetical protein